MMNPTTDDIIALSRRVDEFMAIPRATVRRGRYETDGEHTLHLQFISVLYAARYHPELDSGKVVLYALVHDFIELYTGDVNSLKITTASFKRKQQLEELALKELENEFASRWPELVYYVVRYERLEDPEAQFVKYFDSCDAALSHAQDGGEAFRRMDITTSKELIAWDNRVQTRLRKQAYDFPDLLMLRKEFLAKSIERAFPSV